MFGIDALEDAEHTRVRFPSGTPMARPWREWRGASDRVSRFTTSQHGRGKPSLNKVPGRPDRDGQAAAPTAPQRDSAGVLDDAQRAETGLAIYRAHVGDD